MSVEIVSIGSYLPKRVMTNDEWSQYCDTNDEWIVSHTGIKTRHIAAEDEATASMGAQAAKEAIEKANIHPDQINLVIVATVSPDYLGFPASANLVQKILNIPSSAAAFDLHAACTGFVYALSTAQAFLSSSRDMEYALVIASETLSRIMNWKDRSTAILFGDGAAAMLLKKSNTKNSILDTVLHSDGNAQALVRPKGGSFCKEFSDVEETYIQMDGRSVYNFAVHSLGEVIDEILERNQLSIDDIGWIVPHQANYRIIEAMCLRRKWPLEKFFMNLEHMGNTSAASIPLALAEMENKKMLKTGQKIIMAGFGGGLTWGATLVEW
ncbi:MAG: beta-ketoacyl-ACP synthase III [Spirochaetia bacterium]